MAQPPWARQFEMNGTRCFPRVPSRIPSCSRDPPLSAQNSWAPAGASRGHLSRTLCELLRKWQSLIGWPQPRKAH
jgi:hypothetical protein